MRFGLDYLGGAKFGNLIAREHPQGWAAGFFANTFGNAWPVVEKLIQTTRCPEVRIHAIWEDNHTYNAAKHDPIIFKEQARANALKAKYPHITVQFSPFCEHNIRGSALVRLFQKLIERNQGCELINSIWQGDTFPGVKTEVHGSKAQPQKGAFNWSSDGDSAVDIDIEALKSRLSGADTFYFWIPQFNLKKTVADSTPRPQRKAVPTGQGIDSVIYLATSRGDASLDRKHIWKSHADQHNIPPEPRALKPVFITPARATRIELVASNGQVVHRSGVGSPFSGGGYRYYFDQFGYQIAEKAKRIQGHGVLRIRAGDKILGTINAAFRAGSFR